MNAGQYHNTNGSLDKMNVIDFCIIGKIQQDNYLAFSLSLKLLLLKLSLLTKEVSISDMNGGKLTKLQVFTYNCLLFQDKI